LQDRTAASLTGYVPGALARAGCPGL